MSRQQHPHQRRPLQRPTRVQDIQDIDAHDRPAQTHASALPEALQAFRIDAPVDEHLPSMRRDRETSGQPRAEGFSPEPRRATIVQPPLQGPPQVGRHIRLSSASPTSETFDTMTVQPPRHETARGVVQSETPPSFGSQHMSTNRSHSRPQVERQPLPSHLPHQYEPHSRAVAVGTAPAPRRPHSAVDSAYLSDLSTVSGTSSARTVPPSHASASADSTQSHSASSGSPGMPGGSWEREAHRREILRPGAIARAGASRRQASFSQDEQLDYDLPSSRGSTARRAHFPVSTLRGGSPMNRAQSYAYGYGSSEAGGVFREKAPAGSSSHDVHRYREPEPEGPSPTWSGSEHDADMEATAPSRRGRSRVSRGGILERSEIVLNSPDSEDRTEYYDQRRYAQPSSQSYPPRFSYAEEENHRLHSQRQELLQRTDENRSYPINSGYSSEGEPRRRSLPYLSPEGRHRMREVPLTHDPSINPAYAYSENPREQIMLRSVPAPIHDPGSTPHSPHNRSYVFPAVSDERERPSNSMAESRRLPPLDPRFDGRLALTSGRGYHAHALAPAHGGDLYPSTYLRGPGTRTPPPVHTSSSGRIFQPGTGAQVVPFGSVPPALRDGSLPRAHLRFSPSALSTSLPERESGMSRVVDPWPVPGDVERNSMSRLPPRLGTSASPRLRYAYPGDGRGQPARNQSPRSIGLRLYMPHDSSPPPKRSRTLSPDPPLSAGRLPRIFQANPSPPITQPHVSELEDAARVTRDGSLRNRGGNGRSRGRGMRQFPVAPDPASPFASGSQTPAFSSSSQSKTQPQSQEPFDQSVIHPDLRSVPSAPTIDIASAQQPLAGPSALRERGEDALKYASAEEYELDETDDEYHGSDFAVGSPISKVARRAPRAKIDVACDFCRKRKMRCDGLRPSCRNCMKKNEPCVYINEVRRRGPGKKQKKTTTDAAAARPRRARPGKEKEPESGAEQPQSSTKEARRKAKGKGRVVDRGSAVESDVDFQGEGGPIVTSSSMVMPAAGGSMGGIYGSSTQQIPLEQTGPPPVGIGLRPGEMASGPYAATYLPGRYPPEGSPVNAQTDVVLGEDTFSIANDPSTGENRPLALQMGTGDGVSVMEQGPVSAVTRTSGALSSGPSSSEGEVRQTGRRRALKRVKMEDMEVDEEEGK